MIRPEIPLLDIQAWRAGTPTQKARLASATVTPATVTPAPGTVENTRVLG